MPCRKQHDTEPEERTCFRCWLDYWRNRMKHLLLPLLAAMVAGCACPQPRAINIVNSAFFTGKTYQVDDGCNTCNCQDDLCLCTAMFCRTTTEAK